MIRNRSHALFNEATQYIVGGVNSPSRSFKAVGGEAPVFMKKAKGAYFWDVDDNRYIDYLAAYGPIIAGHTHPHIVEAITAAAQTGVLYGTPTEYEIQFAKMLTEAIPSLDQVRFVNSGTEAVMTTIRVARAYTGRNKIIKFSGCYHGHADLVLVAAGSGPATLGTPDSAGITENTAKEVITVPYNDIEALKKALHEWGDDVAAVMIEPIVGNFGIVTPKPGFLEELCALTRQHGALVIYDEIIAAFRFHYGAAHHHPMFPDHEAIEPDLTALGKIIGGGLPIGAYGGKREIMEQVAPLGPAYQAGTMAGNPASIRAGIACLEVLQNADRYQKMEQLTAQLAVGIRKSAEIHGVPLTVNQLGGAFSTHFCDHLVTSYEEAEQTDEKQFAAFFHALLDEGVCIAPSRYEAWFLTLAHTKEDIEQTIDAADRALAKVAAKLS